MTNVEQLPVWASILLGIRADGTQPKNAEEPEPTPASPTETVN